MTWDGTLDAAIRYAGSDAGRGFRARLLEALRELDQLRAERGPVFVTADEMAQAWSDTHNREEQENTRAHLNAILRNRTGATAEHRGASTRALELWAMDVLDAWAADGRFWQCDDSEVQTFIHCDSAPTCHWSELTVTSPASAARIAAARALKAAHPELPDEPKGSE